MYATKGRRCTRRERSRVVFLGWGERKLKGKTHYFADFRDGPEVSREI
jgi:hypothetical protein